MYKPFASEVVVGYSFGLLLRYIRSYSVSGPEVDSQSVAPFANQATAAYTTESVEEVTLYDPTSPEIRRQLSPCSSWDTAHGRVALQKNLRVVGVLPFC